MRCAEAFDEPLLCCPFVYAFRPVHFMPLPGWCGTHTPARSARRRGSKRCTLGGFESETGETTRLAGRTFLRIVQKPLINFCFAARSRMRFADLRHTLAWLVRHAYTCAECPRGDGRQRALNGLKSEEEKRHGAGRKFICVAQKPLINRCFVARSRMRFADLRHAPA